MSDKLPAKLGSGALAAEQARLARFFQTINKHRKALPGLIESARVWLHHHDIELW